VVVQFVTGHLESFLVYTGTMIGLLVISRQIVALVENRQQQQRWVCVWKVRPRDDASQSAGVTLRWATDGPA